MLTLNGSKKRVIVTQDHKVFLGEGLGDATFEIVADPLSFTQESELRKKFTTYNNGVELVDTPAFIKALFQKQVISWNGIAFDGEGDVDCTAANKERALDANFDFCSKVMTAIRQESDKIGVAKAEEAKN
jgi:hypothetical protein